MLLNSRQNGTYGREKKYYHSLPPVNSSFSLLLTVSLESYKIHVNSHIIRKTRPQAF